MVSCGGEPGFGHGLATDVVIGQPSSRSTGEAEWNIMGERRSKRCVAHGHRDDASRFWPTRDAPHTPPKWRVLGGEPGPHRQIVRPEILRWLGSVRRERWTKDTTSPAKRQARRYKGKGVFAHCIELEQSTWTRLTRPTCLEMSEYSAEPVPGTRPECSTVRSAYESRPLPLAAAARDPRWMGQPPPTTSHRVPGGGKPRPQGAAEGAAPLFVIDLRS